MIVFNELGVNLDTKKLIVDVSVKSNIYYESTYMYNIYIDTQDTYLEGGPSEKAKMIEIPSDMLSLETRVIIPEVIGQRSLDIVTIKVPFNITSLNKYILNLEGIMFSTLNIIGEDDTATYSYSRDSEDFIYYRLNYSSGSITEEKKSKNLDSFLQDFNGAKHYRLELDESELNSTVANNMYFVYVETKVKTNDFGNYTLGITLNTATIYNDMMLFIKKVSDGQDIPKEFINYFLEFEAFRLSIRTGHNRQAINYFNKFFKKPLTAQYTINNCYG